MRVNHSLLIIPLLIMHVPVSALGFLDGSRRKERQPASAGNLRYAGSIPGLEGPLEKEMTTHSAFLPGESHEQRTQVG